MKEKAVDLFRRFTWLDWLLLVILLGFLFYFVIVGSSRLLHRPSPVEYLAKSDQANKNISQNELWVDVSGAVTRPGVYKLESKARIKDALVAAGGFSEDADREFVAREINLASKVTDGQKIFVPKAIVKTKPDSVVIGASISEKININSAGREQLDSLYGIGAARAEEIIKNRPYLKIDDLLTKKILTKTIFEKIKDKISVY